MEGEKSGPNGLEPDSELQVVLSLHPTSSTCEPEGAQAARQDAPSAIFLNIIVSCHQRPCSLPSVLADGCLRARVIRECFNR